MSKDLDALLLWYRIVCVVCSITTTAVPILYSFTPWRTRLFGKLFMVQAISFAIAMDLTTLFAFWRPVNILIRFWVGIGILSLIGLSTSAIAIMMFVIPLQVRRKVRNGVQQEGV